MPARANAVLADGESTPVNHTFVPDGDVAAGWNRYINANSAVPAASELLYIQHVRSGSKPEEYSTPSKKVQPNKWLMKILYPSTYVDSTTGLTLVDFIDEHIYTSLCHPRSSQQRRKNGRTMIANGLAVFGVAVHDPFLQIF